MIIASHSPFRVIFPKSYSENHLCFYAVLLFKEGVPPSGRAPSSTLYSTCKYFVCVLALCKSFSACGLRIVPVGLLVTYRVNFGDFW